MDWLINLFTASTTAAGGANIAQSVVILALVVTIGIFLGRIKIAGVSLGIT